jgi:methionyl-tRNA synthetase
VRSIGILILPFLPDTGKQIAEQLNLPADPSSLRWPDAGKLDLKPGHVIGKPKPLFHKVTAPSSS